MNKVIDLRSDTVTVPDEPMRRAMYEAEVGDDVYAEDPTINRLQELAAGMFAREDALLVPTGSMGNTICLDVLARPGTEVICDKLSHIYNYELSSMTVFSGLMPRVVEGERGCPDAEQIVSEIHPDIYYVAPTGCISVENTANIAGGRIFPLDRLKKVTELAASKNIPLHMDGARIFNSSVALGRPVSELTEGVDAVMFCLSKGLGAPVGSMVVEAGSLSNRLESAVSGWVAGCARPVFWLPQVFMRWSTTWSAWTMTTSTPAGWLKLLVRWTAWKWTWRRWIQILSWSQLSPPRRMRKSFAAGSTPPECGSIRWGKT